ncbi:uncharacterized protein ACA1_384050 [Acanthamoeba castellanii str. Neff]|uniref:Uncharacterized protein n=1 Tax=Acanthamoeba castellanii (strain ATCC 30010 / Neff) TaxID=1257118 RepID=L8H902_ACACF|nr:uncharacterized protein ACA1_384050 [Acanthamoeba castellanii str. Neff]ELR21702.1 hypothetical protein ACA1_384050 [Acanthamoeba castellanii str. Neff]
MKIKSLSTTLGCALIFAFFAAAVAETEPKYPVWPAQFTVDFDVLVPDYGKNFVKKGALYYDYKTQRARADYYDWCIPLFDGTSGGGPNLYNETCSFLMTPKGAFFISPTFPIKEDRCCYFADIPPPTPDWLKNTRYNTTEA